MPEPVAIQPEQNPQIPVSFADEHNREASTPLPSSLGEKIRNVTAPVLAKFKIARTGRGRPRADGQPKISDVVVAEKAAMVPPAQNPAAVSLFRRSIVAAAKGAFGCLKKFVRWKATEAGIDREFTEKVLRDAEPDNSAMEDFSESLQMVLEKRGVTSENAPEWALAINAGRIAAPYFLLLKEFQEEIRRNREKEKERRKENV